MSTIQFEKPRWLRDLLRVLSLKNQFVLSGNIQDLETYAVSPGTPNPVPRQTSLVIELYQREYEHVVAFDVVRGVNPELHLLIEPGRANFAQYLRQRDATDDRFDLLTDERVTASLAGIPKHGDLDRLRSILHVQGTTYQATEDRYLRS